MIPKIIHFCWLSGDKYPNKIAYCINSWKKHLPDYEIRLWDLTQFDIESTVWCKEAFESKKYAFAADYIRCHALYHYGGIYLDSDVEVLKNFDKLLSLPYFIGTEQCGEIEPAVIGCEKGWPFLKQMLDYYDGRHFKNPDGFDMVTLPRIMSEEIKRNYDLRLISSISDYETDNGKFSVFTPEFFSPKFPNSFKCIPTPNTFAVHHFAASWYPVDKKIFRMISKLLGYKVALMISKIIKG